MLCTNFFQLCKLVLSTRFAFVLSLDFLNSRKRLCFHTVRQLLPQIADKCWLGHANFLGNLVKVDPVRLCYCANVIVAFNPPCKIFYNHLTNNLLCGIIIAKTVIVVIVLL